MDHLLPEAPYRQWVLTFPWAMRFRLAMDRRLLSRMLAVYLRTLFSWQRRRGRSVGLVGGQTGAVTFVQRFGGALNLNPHLHSVLPDGLFVPGDPGCGSSPAPLRFVPLPPPTQAEIQELAATLAARLTACLTAAWENDGHSGIDPALAGLSEALFWSQHAPPGTRDLPVLSGLQGAPSGPGPEAGLPETLGPQGKALCASVAGFSLHAAQFVPAEDREALERLLRYGLRAPFSQGRLSVRPDGKVVYRPRRPWPNAQGSTYLILEPLDFLRRLAALISYPYSHQVRYHGVFANRSRFRKLLPAPPITRDAGCAHGDGDEVDEIRQGAGLLFGEEPSDSHPRGDASPDSPQDSTSRRRLPWAQLLRRLLHIDALACPRCSTTSESVPMVVLAFLTDPEVVSRILRHLDLPVQAPSLAPVRWAEVGEAQGGLGFELEQGEDSISESQEGGEDDLWDGDSDGRPP